MEEHILNNRVGAMPRPIPGEVRAVHHAPTIGETVIPFTLYDVEVWPQAEGFSGALAFAKLAYQGQQGGGAIEQNVPLIVGQKVSVDFWENDYNRPYIKSKWIDESSALAADPSDADTHPKARWIINGAAPEVDKDGNIALSLADGRSLTIKDSAGAVLLEIKLVGGSYEVHLGGESGLRTLLQSSFVDVVRAALATFVPVPNEREGHLQNLQRP